MDKKNKKGFTLIELLAVIVILGVLLAIAVPSVTKYINVSKKSTYVDNAQTYATTATYQANLGTFKFPINGNDATVISFGKLVEYLEKGGKTSPYGTAYNSEQSFVVIVNDGSAEAPHYTTYIAAIDAQGYGIGTLKDGTATAATIAYNDLTTDNIVQLTTGVKMPEKGATITLNGTTFTITEAVK